VEQTDLLRHTLDALERVAIPYMLVGSFASTAYGEPRLDKISAKEKEAMTTQVTATVVDGVFKPDQPLPLPNQTRVKLTVEPIEDWSPAKAIAAWEALTARLRERPIHGGGVRYTRDELHERR